METKQTKRKIKRIAYHEAGHALMALARGMPVKMVTIVPFRTNWVRSDASEPEVFTDHNTHLLGACFFEDGGTVTSVLNSVDVSVAGARAEVAISRIIGKPLTEREAVYIMRGDHRNIRDAVCSVDPDMYYDEKNFDTVMLQSRRRCDKILFHYWNVVELIAEALIIKKVLTGDEVLKIKNKAVSEMIDNGN